MKFESEYNIFCLKKKWIWNIVCKMSAILLWPQLILAWYTGSSPFLFVRYKLLYEPVHILSLISIYWTTWPQNYLHSWLYSAIYLLQVVACVRTAILGSGVCEKLAHWGLNKIAPFMQTTFSKSCSWMKIIAYWAAFLPSAFQAEGVLSLPASVHPSIHKLDNSSVITDLS